MPLLTDLKQDPVQHHLTTNDEPRVTAFTFELSKTPSHPIHMDRYLEFFALGRSSRRNDTQQTQSRSQAWQSGAVIANSKSSKPTDISWILESLTGVERHRRSRSGVPSIIHMGWKACFCQWGEISISTPISCATRSLEECPNSSQTSLRDLSSLRHTLELRVGLAKSRHETSLHKSAEELLIVLHQNGSSENVRNVFYSRHPFIFTKNLDRNLSGRWCFDQPWRIYHQTGRCGDIVHCYDLRLVRLRRTLKATIMMLILQAPSGRL